MKLEDIPKLDDDFLVKSPVEAGKALKIIAENVIALQELLFKMQSETRTYMNTNNNVLRNYAEIFKSLRDIAKLP